SFQMSTSISARLWVTQGGRFPRPTRTLSPEGCGGRSSEDRPPHEAQARGESHRASPGGGGPLRTVRIVDDWLDTLEAMQDDERWASLAYVAGQQVELDSDELNGALRRGMLLLATGGDPQR